MSVRGSRTRASELRWLAALLLAATPVLGAQPAEAAPARNRPAPAQKRTAPVKQAAAKRIAAPVVSPVVSLTVAPAGAVLEGPRARQQLLVTGVRKDGSLVDLTAQAKFASATPAVAAVGADGVVRPVGDGTAAVRVTAAGKSTTYTIAARNVSAPFTWNFRNHVQAVLSKTGCNMGACHGAAAGKNGFRLTLRAYDHELDYERLLFESGGRRIQRNDPGNSLLLKKATMAVPHAGGLRFKPGTLEYKVLAEWIAAGMPGPSEKDPLLQRIEVLPAQRTLTEKARQQLIVRAHYNNGQVTDVTNWARFISNEEGVAAVNDDGVVETRGPGETAVTVMFGDKVTFARIAVPFPNNPAPTEYDYLAGGGYIDRLVAAKLKTLRIAWMSSGRSPAPPRSALSWRIAAPTSGRA
jgi:hypothetical protein